MKLGSPLSVAGCALLAALALGCTAIVDRFSGRGEACAIVATGAPALATVVALRDSGTTINDDPVVIFVLDVVPLDGAPFRAESKALVSRLDIPRVQPGAVFPAKFDPQDHTRVALDIWECPVPEGRK